MHVKVFCGETGARRAPAQDAGVHVHRAQLLFEKKLERVLKAPFKRENGNHALQGTFVPLFCGVDQL